MDTNDDTVGGERVETLQGVGGETRLALLAVGQHRCVDAHQPIDRLRPCLIDQSFDVVVAEFSCGELCQSIDQVLRAGNAADRFRGMVMDILRLRGWTTRSPITTSDDRPVDRPRR